MTGPGPDGAADLEEAGPPPTRRRWPVLLVVVVLLAGLGVGLGLSLSGGPTPAVKGPEGVVLQEAPDLASAATTRSGSPVDGITCRPTMQQTEGYHVHAHVAIYVNGQLERLPAGAGIANRFPEHLANGLFVDNSDTGCLYWLHVHANDGIIHIEAPAKATFTLGQFFDIWDQPLGPDQVGPTKGAVVAFVNGHRFGGNPRDVPLLAHAVIQLDVGTPVVPFTPVKFNVTGLCAAGGAGCNQSDKG